MINKETTTKVSILVVDDNYNLAESMRDLLDTLGYDVAVANDGYAAVSQVENGSFDISLMDIIMPGLNGVETFKKIKAINPGIKVIMMTGYSDEELIKEAVLEGAYEVMNKPVDFGKLIELIGEIIDKEST